MDDKTTPIEVFLKRAQAYTKTSIQLLKFKATEKLAELISNMASGVILIAIFVLFFINLNIGIAILLGHLFGVLWIGFILVAGFYACIGFAIYLLRNKWIKAPLKNSIITQLLKDE